MVIFESAPCRDKGIIEILFNEFRVSPLALLGSGCLLRTQNKRKYPHIGELPIDPAESVDSDFIMAFKSKEAIIWGCSLSLCVT